MAIKDFIVNVLGCRCPDEVFSSIELEKAANALGSIPLLFRINVGGRLLILGVRGESFLIGADAFAQFVVCSVSMRDEGRYNRLRIVVVSDDPACEARLRPIFEVSPGVGDRIHLHVLKEDVVKDMLAGNLACMERGERWKS